jgi:hypothetical protein
MTIANLFAKHRAGEISKEKFLYEARKDSNLPWITNLTSYTDAVSILKNKGVIKEAVVENKNTDTFDLNASAGFLTEQKDFHLEIDRLNPILVNKAINSELEKIAKVDAESYQNTVKKVVKKLQKDPRAYDDVVVSNAKEVNKADEKLKMAPIKDNNFKDEQNQMKKVKGVEVAKANVKATKKENKKGKPKGVKEMQSVAKNQKGLAIMESLLSFVFKKKLNEDVHHSYAVGQQIKTPEGEGILDGIVGDTLSVKFENGNIKDYQLNMIERLKEMDNQPDITPEVVKHEPEVTEAKDKRDAIIKKIMELLKKKKKIKKEVTIVGPMTPPGEAQAIAKGEKTDVKTVQAAMVQAKQTNQPVRVAESKK